jgi:hypothetical protein
MTSIDEGAGLIRLNIDPLPIAHRLWHARPHAPDRATEIDFSTAIDGTPPYSAHVNFDPEGAAPAIYQRPWRDRPMTSFRQIEANRRNALRSTGPNTEAGKLRSLRNAIRHGLPLKRSSTLLRTPTTTVGSKRLSSQITMRAPPSNAS